MAVVLNGLKRRNQINENIIVESKILLNKEALNNKTLCIKPTFLIFANFTYKICFNDVDAICNIM